MVRSCWKPIVDENNEDEEMEEGIGVSWASECCWLLLEEPLRFFDGSAIWEIFLKFQSVEMKENEKWRILGFVGSDLHKKWLSSGVGKMLFIYIYIYIYIYILWGSLFYVRVSSKSRLLDISSWTVKINTQIVLKVKWLF